MRKDAFNLCLTTAVLAVFGFFLRWLQNMNAFEPDTGLAIAGAKTSAVFIIYSIAALVLLIFADRIYLGRRCTLAAGAESLQCSTPIHKALLWLCAALCGIGWLVVMFSAGGAAFPTMQRITAAMGILAAAALPFVFPSKKEGEGSALASTAAIIPVLFCCVWLVSDYRVHAENPVRWEYVVQILAIVALTMSFFHLAAFFYNKAKPMSCLLFCQMATYLCGCTLIDEHAAVKKLVFAASKQAV